MSIIGYKKVYKDGREYVLKLEIIGAIVGAAGFDKMRTSEAVVLAFKSVHYVQAKWPTMPYFRSGKWSKDKLAGPFHSGYDNDFEYRVGARVFPRFGFNNDIEDDCGSGIHFFLDEKLAIEY